MAGNASDLDPLDGAVVNAVREAGLTDVEVADSLDALKAVRAMLLGDQAPLMTTNRTIGSLEPAQRGLADKSFGQAHKVLAEALEECKTVLAAKREARILVEESVNMTLPTMRRPAGVHHPLETLMEEVANFFMVMGWDIAGGPEIEHKWLNFDSLNFDINYLARQMQSTLYIDGHDVGVEAKDGTHLVMRTHTSPVQPHAMLSRDVLLYVACPDKIFRSDALDATHTPVLHQVEGFAIDRDLTMAHLKGVLDHFAKAVFGPEAKTRLCPSYFPFTEPSTEMGLWFLQKKGDPGQIEWGGCDMVDPNVLRTNDVNPEVCSSFAFDVGIERTLMLRHSIVDMHDIVEGDAHFSQQFGIDGRGN